VNGINLPKALITGGAGFVGRHLAFRLLNMNWEVVVVDNLANGSGGIPPLSGWPLFNPFDYKNFSFINRDCRDYFKSELNEKFDYIFHLAAIVGGRITIEKNPLAVAEDLAIDSDMWSWATKGNVHKVVNFSSSAAYPVNLQASTDEYISLKEDLISFDGNIGMPDLTYGWSKLTSEYLGKIAWERHGIKSVVYRPFSGYGKDQDLTYPFPSICKRAVESQNLPTFKVWGNGKQSRDFIHIEDCITGVLATMDKVDDGSALNLSTGVPTSFLDFARIATRQCGYSPEIVGDESKPTGVLSRVGDTTKQKLMGFSSSISIDKGIVECIEYFQMHSNETIK
jgi:nucleoside-diphosphate-sugar epimerase